MCDELLLINLSLSPQLHAPPSSIAAQRRRSGSLPTLLESPYALSSLRGAHYPTEESIEELEDPMTSAMTSPGSSASPYAYTFPPPPPSSSDRDNSNNIDNHNNNTRSHAYDGRSSSSLSETKTRNAPGTITGTGTGGPTSQHQNRLPPVLSPQKRHLAPRTRLSIAITSPASSSSSSSQLPQSSLPLRSPFGKNHNGAVAGPSTPTPLPPSPFRLAHAHGGGANSNISSSNQGQSLRSPTTARTTTTISQPSPPISSFIRKSASNNHLRGHPSSSPLESTFASAGTGPGTGITGGGVRTSSTGGGGGNDPPMEESGQRYKRRGSLTLSLAPLSLSVSRHNRALGHGHGLGNHQHHHQQQQAHAHQKAQQQQQQQQQHRRTNSNSSLNAHPGASPSTTGAAHSPIQPILNTHTNILGTGMALTTTPTQMHPSQSPLSPMAIPTLPDVSGLAQRNTTIIGGASTSSTFVIASNSPISASGGNHIAGPMQMPMLPPFMPPTLPTLPVLTPLGLGSNAAAGNDKPSLATRGSTGRMRSIGHMRMGSGDRDRELRDRERDAHREKRIRNSASTSSFLPPHSQHPSHSTSLPIPPPPPTLLSHNSWGGVRDQQTHNSGSSSGASTSGSAKRPPANFLRRNATAPSIVIKKEEEDSEIDELESDMIEDERATHLRQHPHNPFAFSSSPRVPRRSHYDEEERDADAEYASTSAASSISDSARNPREARTGPPRTKERDGGYDAQDEMQLDDPDEYERPLSARSAALRSRLGVNSGARATMTSIPISSQRRASLHPLSEHHPNTVYDATSHHVRSHSDDGPIGLGNTNDSPRGDERRTMRPGLGLGGNNSSRMAPPVHSFSRPFAPHSHSSSSSSSSPPYPYSPHGLSNLKIARHSESRSDSSPSASSAGTRTPTGISSSRGGSAGPSSASATPPSTRPSPPSVVVSSAA